MNELIKIENGEVLADSRMIAEHFEKRHADVLTDIRDEMSKLGTEGERVFSLSSYTSEQNKSLPCYTMNEEGIMQLAARYDAVARRKLIVMIKELKEKQPKLSSLQILELQLQAMKEHEKKILAIETTVDNIKDTIVKESDHWREDVNHMINKISKSVGFNKFSEVRTESYKALEHRAGVNLKQRLANMRNRLLEDGASQTKIKNLNNMDVIEQDKKLCEIYMSIVKEYFIKYCA